MGPSSLLRFRLKSNAPTSHPELAAMAHGSMLSSCQFDEDGPIVASQVQLHHQRQAAVDPGALRVSRPVMT
ncbi:hypothetical protein Y032_0081g1429 [Ancylostoma ceylanicum]|uniref:Uncharacterized protein n=1 Tax=Ancylostoma ceylanicum TaxID=53326 RepID=A0A016TS21_9BILA|nr:hypothetical protein Y032_0081g1429 [Ancylostoma ceylanicum]